MGVTATDLDTDTFPVAADLLDELGFPDGAAFLRRAAETALTLKLVMLGEDHAALIGMGYLELLARLKEIE